MNQALFDYTLRLADTSLILGHRLSEWCGHGPLLEEDIAMTNLGLDLIGQSRSLYTYAGEIEGKGRDEDALAYLRDVFDFKNILMAERPNGDFAVTMARQFLFAAYMHPFWFEMMNSKDETLAAIAAKSEKELSYHLRHSGEWMIRLGDGTDESAERAQAALDLIWPFTGEMFETDADEDALIAEGIAIDPTTLKPVWDRTVDEVLGRANLKRPDAGWMQTGGRIGRHSEHLGHILADMQFLQRAYPGASW